MREIARKFETAERRQNFLENFYRTRDIVLFLERNLAILISTYNIIIIMDLDIFEIIIIRQSNGNIFLIILDDVIRIFDKSLEFLNNNM